MLQTEMTSPNYSTSRFRFSQDNVLIGDYYYYPMEINREETGDNWQAYSAYFRESAAVVYTLENGIEYEVYDFTLNVPDSFSLEILGGSGFFMLTKKVDEITFLDQVARKRLTMSCYSDPENWNHYWVEGIGDIDLGPFGASCLTDINSQLLCFHFQGELVYTSDFGFCFRTSSNGFIKDYDVKIFPNPASNMIFIQTELRFNEVSIFDLLGKAMLSSEQFGEGFDVSKLPQGLYYIRLTNPENRIATATFTKL